MENRLRLTLYRQLAPECRGEEGLSATNQIVCVLIILASLVAILETEVSIRANHAWWFVVFEVFFVSVFTVEYIARLYAAGEDRRYRGVRGRLRYALTPGALVDLIAILPSFFLLLGYNALILRLLKIFRLVRIGRFNRAWAALAHALRSRVHELVLSGGAAGLVLVFSASSLYVVEAEHQPEAFGSIPRALWWSIATLTTVGYGDVTPVTALGKLLAGITAIAGIGLIAMPTGILAAAFSDAFQKREFRPEDER
jgi:voltage-gated potassium channel